MIVRNLQEVQLTQVRKMLMVQLLKVKKVNFGHGGTTAKKAGQKTMSIRKSNPKARSAFRARHNCSNPVPKTMARYWSCKKW